MLRKLLLAGVAALGFALPAAAQTQVNGLAFRNALVCGDATTCPWQRASPTATITSSAVVAGDYWTAIGGASSAMTISKATQTGVNGFGNAFQMQRTASNTNTAALNFGQVLDTLKSVQFQGKTACFSFNILAGSNFSAASGAVTYTVTYGTGSLQGYASLVAGTWTGTTTVMTGTVTTTTTMQYVSKCAQVPTTATEIGVNISWTPVGTAGTNDYIQVNALQLEAVPFAQNPQPTSYENRDAAVERMLAQVRSYVITEPAASVSVANGSAITTGYCQILIPLPTTMRAAPTISFAGTTLGATTWALLSASATPIVLASTYLVQSVISTANSTDMVALKATGLSTPFTAGFGCQLVGAGGGSIIIASADLL